MTPRVTALITGAGSGIGRGLCAALAAAGYDLIVSDVDLNAAQCVASEIAGTGSHVSLHMDVSDETSVARAVGSVADRPLSVLINNAGLQHVSPVEEYSTDKWDQLVNVMLRGTFLVSRAVIPLMRERGHGRIVNIGSIHSIVASPFKSAYVAAKHGILGMSKALALETADADITINTICPSYVRTPLVDKQIAEQARAHNLPIEEVIDRIMLQPMPKKAFITIDEIAAAVEYLVSDAARNVTGQRLVIDGGWTIK